MKRMLLIVDPQVDFITGSLPVPGAVAAMDALSAFIGEHAGDFSHIVVTADRHPFSHCSFVENGGPWPRHCLQDSVGAAVWPSLMDALCGCSDRVTILHKGEDPDKEEYSVFSNPAAERRIMRIVRDMNVGQIDICGLAGDVCVAATISGGIVIPDMPRFSLLSRFTPSLDGGSALYELTLKHNILCDR